MREDREPAIDGYAVACGRNFQRIFVRIELVKHSIHASLPDFVGHGLLQAQDIGLLCLDIFKNRELTVSMSLPTGKAPHIIRHHFDGILGNIVRNIERNVGSDGHIAHQIAHDGKPYALLLDAKPKEQKAEIEGEEHGKHQANIGQQLMFHGIKAVREAHERHHEDGGQIGSGHDLQGKPLDATQHTPLCQCRLLLSKSFRFSSAVRLS